METKCKCRLTERQIECGNECDGCGFNPEEKRRRLESGVWLTNAEGKKYLCFPRVQKVGEK